MIAGITVQVISSRRFPAVREACDSGRRRPRTTTMASRTQTVSRTKLRMPRTSKAKVRILSAAEPAGSKKLGRLAAAAAPAIARVSTHVAMMSRVRAVR